MCGLKIHTGALPHLMYICRSTHFYFVDQRPDRLRLVDHEGTSFCGYHGDEVVGLVYPDDDVDGGRSILIEGGLEVILGRRKSQRCKTFN